MKIWHCVDKAVDGLSVTSGRRRADQDSERCICSMRSLGARTHDDVAGGERAELWQRMSVWRVKELKARRYRSCETTSGERQSSTRGASEASGCCRLAVC